MKEHPSAENFSAYLEGKLPRGGVLRQAFEEHLSQCDVCLESLLELAEINRRGNEIPADFMNQAWARMRLPARERTPWFRRALRQPARERTPWLPRILRQPARERTPWLPRILRQPARERTPVRRGRLPWALRLAALFLVLGVLTFFYLFDGRPIPDGRMSRSLGEKSVPGGAQRQVQPTPARNEHAEAAAVRDEKAAEMKGNHFAGKKATPGPVGMTSPGGGSKEKSERVAAVPTSAGDAAASPEAVAEAPKEALKIADSLEKEAPPSRPKGEAVAGVADVETGKDKKQTMPTAQQATRQRYYRNQVQATVSQAAVVLPVIVGDVSRSDWQNPQLAAQLPALNREVTCLVDIDSRGRITALAVSGELPVGTRTALEKWVRLMVFTPDSRRLRQATITFSPGPGPKVN